MLWQPIDSAPRNGNPILLWVPNGIDTNDAANWIPGNTLHVMIGWWDDDRWSRQEGYDWETPIAEEGSADSYGCAPILNLHVRATHWMPLPNPPTPSAPARKPSDR